MQTTASTKARVRCKRLHCHVPARLKLVSLSSACELSALLPLQVALGEKRERHIVGATSSMIFGWVASMAGESSVLASRYCSEAGMIWNLHSMACIASKPIKNANYSSVDGLLPSISRLEEQPCRFRRVISASQPACFSTLGAFFMRSSCPTQARRVSIFDDATCGIIAVAIVPFVTASERLVAQQLQCDPKLKQVRNVVHYAAVYVRTSFDSMHRHEIRVHIAAPSMVKDDARWKSIAQGVARFKPARRLILSDTIVDTSRVSTSTGVVNLPSPTPHMSISSRSRDSSPEDTPTQTISTGIRMMQAEDFGRDASRKRTRDDTDGADSDRARRTKHMSYARTKQGVNPAFRSHMTRHFRHDKEFLETPRPRTAPEATVQVPFTTSPKFQRSSSDVQRHASQSDSVVTDVCHTDQVRETSFVDESPVNNTSLQCQQFPQFPNTLHTSSFERRRPPTNQEQLQRIDQTEDVVTIDDNVTFRLSQSSLDEDEMMMGTRKRDTPKSSHPCGRDEASSHYDNSLATSHTTEAPSAADLHRNNSSPLRPRIPPVPVPIIDLTEGVQECDQHITRREVLGPVSSPTRHPVEGDFSSSRSPPQRDFDLVWRLPRRIECQASNTNIDHQFTSFVPDYLRPLARKLKLLDRFRPLQAPASLENSQRGYWRLLIKITDVTTAAKSRREPPTDSQWSDDLFLTRQRKQVDEHATRSERHAVLVRMVYPAKNVDEHTPWTAEEFIQFWECITKIVERGRAGYDVRATMTSPPEAEDDTLIEARCWCYAEVLSHLWLVLYGLSYKLTSHMPLQWCVPGVGPVIVMSGQRNNPGSNGRWVEKSEGIHGSWGLEEA